MRYQVSIEDIDGMKKETICHDYNDLVNLITNIDGSKYTIDCIWQQEDLNIDYRDFCKKDENLETGEK